MSAAAGSFRSLRIAAPPRVSSHLTKPLQCRTRGAWMTHMGTNDFDWNTTWAMIGAIASIITIVITIVISVFASWRRKRKEREKVERDRQAKIAAQEEAQRQEEQERRAQASLIYLEGPSAGENAMRLTEPRVVIHNDSPRPIYDPVVTFYEDGFGKEYKEACGRAIPPGGNKKVEMCPSVLTRKWLWLDKPDPENGRIYRLPSNDASMDLNATLTFRDDDQNWWFRDRKNNLSPWDPSKG